MARTNTKVINLPNGIDIVLNAVTDSSGFTNITTTVHGMDIEIGNMVSHVGGRPKSPR